MLPIQFTTVPYFRNGECLESGRQYFRADIQDSSVPAIAFFHDLQIGRQPFSVATIAEGGAGVIVQGRPEIQEAVLKYLPEGKSVYLDLHLANERFKVKAQVASRGGKTVGLKFVETHDKLLQHIRQRFQLELTAAALTPFLSYDGAAMGPCHTLIYSDGRKNSFELLVFENQVRGLKVSLEGFGIRLHWERGRSLDIQPKEVPRELIRRKLMSFAWNLQDLGPELRSQIEQILAQV